MILKYIGSNMIQYTESPQIESVLDLDLPGTWDDL